MMMMMMMMMMMIMMMMDVAPHILLDMFALFCFGVAVPRWCVRFELSGVWSSVGVGVGVGVGVRDADGLGFYWS